MKRPLQLGALLLLIALAPARAEELISFFHNDVAGTPLMATDSGGNLLWKENYLPFGVSLNNQPASQANALSFAGKPFEAATGLSYMGARYYEPASGRFMAIDPAGFEPDNLQSFNRYAYGNNNPYKFVDPDGRKIVFAGTAAEIRAIKKELAVALTRTAVREDYAEAKNSKFTYIIGPGAENRAFPDNEVDAQTPGVGSGGHMEFDVNAWPQVQTASGQQATPPSIVLGHELAHFADYARGTLDRSYFPGTTLRRSEAHAMEQENRARAEARAQQLKHGPVRDPIQQRASYY